MAQVVTSENLVEFVTTGKVPEFKPPGAAEPAKANGETKGDIAAKPNEGNQPALDKSKTNGTESASQGRRADGTFAPAEKADATSAEVEKDVADLSERARKQVGKYYRQRKEAEEFATQEGRRALSAEARASALEAELAALKGGKPVVPSSDQSSAKGDDQGELKRPQQKDFTTVGDYAEALAEYLVEMKARKAGAKAAEAAQQHSQQEQASELATGYAARQATFEEAHPDFEQVLEDCDVDVPNVALQYFVESELGPNLAYWLSTPENQHHLIRIQKLSPSRMLAELGKLEAKLETSANPATPNPAPKPGEKDAAGKSPQLSKAPAPITPIASDSNTPAHKDPKDMSFAELREHRRQEQLRGRS